MCRHAFKDSLHFHLLGMNHYYEAPPDAAFEDMRKAAMEIWNTMGNAGGYRDEKIARIKNIANVQDNFMYIFAMFDINNQRRVVSLLDTNTIEEIRTRMEAGGNPKHLIDSILYNV